MASNRPFCTALGIALLVALCGCKITGPAPPPPMPPSKTAAQRQPQPPVAPETESLKFEVVLPKARTNIYDRADEQVADNAIMLPGVRLMTEEEFIVTDPAKATSGQWVSSRTAGSLPKPANGKTFGVAVLDLKSDVKTEGAPGRLAADFIYRELSVHQHAAGARFTLLDRNEVMQKVLEEQKGAQDDVVNLTDKQLFSQIGKVHNCDLWISGAVTAFSIENINARLPWVLDDDSYYRYVKKIAQYRRAYAQYEKDYARYEQAFAEYEKQFNNALQDYERNYRQYVADFQAYARTFDERYVKEYQDYTHGLKTSAGLANFVTFPVRLVLGIVTLGAGHTSYKAEPEPIATKATLIQKVAPVEAMKASKLHVRFPETSKDAVMEVLRNNNRVPEAEHRVVSVANVGVTLRIVENRRSKILWIGNSSARHMDTQRGMQALCKALVAAIMANPQCQKLFMP